MREKGEREKGRDIEKEREKTTRELWGKSRGKENRGKMEKKIEEELWDKGWAKDKERKG